MPRGDGTGPTGQGPGTGGRGRGRRSAGGGRGRMRGPLAAGPGGMCVCPQCGTTAPHGRGVPCAQVPCPKCGTAMTRQG